MKLPALKSADFAAYFHELHGQPGKDRLKPFPWQQRLATAVSENQRWPSLLTLPTAAGKTATIDIALFSLALEAELPPAERRAPRRIFFVIDRRVVVDQALQRAKKIQARLNAALADSSAPAVLRSIAERLLYIGGEAEPLHVASMRGGAVIDETWARSPAQPLICATTVDQIGSRLLFRGYGLSRGKRPIHAALVAMDSLLILDEAHLSSPFAETANAVSDFAAKAEAPIARPLQLVRMTATPPGDEPGFELDDADLADPALAPRLNRAKPAVLISAAADTSDGKQSPFVDEAVKAAKQAAGEEPRVVGIVVNRVQTARAIFDELRNDGADALLLTGRIRPLDRDRLWDRWGKYLAADPIVRQPVERPLFVVATQTIEVGADIDFDALITELAPLDALRQRFGRLNRLGAERTTSGKIIARREQLGARYEDAIYGRTLLPTWQWLERQVVSKSINFSPMNIGARWNTTDTTERATMAPASPRAPIMLPAHVRTWAQTNPAPDPDPDVSLFLHGVREKAPSPEVQIVWRADLDDRRIDWEEAVALLPPSSLETLSLSLSAARHWLRGNADAAIVTDLELSPEQADDDQAGSAKDFLIWRGIRDVRRTSDVATLRPGDTIVVPSSRGGTDEFGWTGTAGERPVTDLAEDAYLTRNRNAPVLRLHEEVLENAGYHVEAERLDQLFEDGARRDIHDLLDALAHPPQDGTEPARPLETAAALMELPLRKLRLTAIPKTNRFLVQRRDRGRLGAVFSFDERGDESSQTTPVLLSNHLAGVAAWARRHAQLCGLSEALKDLLQRAAELHDIGKADPRFQIILHGGDEIAASAALAACELRAKSGSRFIARREREAIRQRARYPEGARHETLSIAMIEAGDIATAHLDRVQGDLLLHLIGSHHGWARPFLSPANDAEPEGVELKLDGAEFHGLTDYSAGDVGSGAADRFAELNARHGAWGLAYLEALLRLADARCSAEEEEEASPR